MANFGRLIALAIALWLGLLLYISTFVLKTEVRQVDSKDADKDGSSGSAADADVLERLQRALSDIELLRQQNVELKSLVTGSRLLPSSPARVSTMQLGDGPSSEAENLRRSAETGAMELWFFVTGELRKFRQRLDDRKDKSLVDSLDKLSADLSEQQRTLWADITKLAKVDGFEDWRRQEMENLTELVQRRLHYLQNPKDCRSARKLLCHLNKGCGYGCQIHHAIYCFTVAIGTGRTLVLDTKGWRYSHKGWESVFLPLSSKCGLEHITGGSEPWRDELAQKEVNTVSLPIVDSLRPRPPYLPLSFPEDLAERLLRAHGNPAAWWLGQLLRYLLRPQPSLVTELDSALRSHKFRHPIVGIHVRRTDKVGAEAQFHSLEEYMGWAEDYFSRLELLEGKPLRERRVFLATDEPNLFEEAAKKFPQYIFVGDQSVANSAGLGSRYSDASLHGVIADIHFLSLTDYLVCTFSSQVCRIAYELMLTYHPDATNWFHSLDDIYYFGGQEAHEQIVVYPHKAASDQQQINLEVGDVVGIAGNHWDGWSKGRNRKTGQTGLYPSYKAVEKWRIVKFPDFADAQSYPFSLPPEMRLPPVGPSYAFNRSFAWKPR